MAYMIYAKKDLGLAGVTWILFGTIIASYLTGLSSGHRIFDALYDPHVDYACLSTNTCFQLQSTSGGTPGLIVKIIGAYLHLYGFVGFVKAIVAGILFGYGVHELTYKAKPLTRHQ
jgi:hypothetical protein